MKPGSDPVSSPAHYRGVGMDAIDALEGFGFGFHLGTAAAYVLRAGRKLDEGEDLRKALWYVSRAKTLPECGANGPGAWAMTKTAEVVKAFGLAPRRAKVLRALANASQEPSYDLLHLAEGLLLCEIAVVDGGRT